MHDSKDTQMGTQTDAYTNSQVYKFIIIYIAHPCCKTLDTLNNTLCTELIVYKFTIINQILIE